MLMLVETILSLAKSLLIDQVNIYASVAPCALVERKSMIQVQRMFVK
jgi:hypothetical protein